MDTTEKDIRNLFANSGELDRDEVAMLLLQLVERIQNLERTPQRTWFGLMRGVRVEGDTVVISVKGGNDAARELCGYLIDEIN